MMTGFQKRAVLLIVLLVSLLAGVAAAAADQELAPEQLALARKYIDLTDNAKLYEITLLQTAKDTMRALVSQNPDLNDPAAKSIVKTLDYYRGRKSDLMDQFARVYAQSFTTEELQAIVTFYESPTGSKLAKANQSLNGSLKLVLNVFTENLNKEFFAKVRADLKAGGFNP